MCVNPSMYPLVKLDTGKRKVLFNYGVIIENRDFTPFDELKLDWRYALKGLSKRHSFNQAVKDFGIVDFEKYTSVPCGKCEECLKSKARGWAFRILKEASLYENNFFLTLTYDDDHIPYSSKGINTLVKDEISKFNKKLKTYLKRKGLKSDFRFYGVGEYGDNTFRPHYHVIYFNLDIPDLEFYNYSNGNIEFTSEFINNIWKNGFVVIGSVDIGSASYVARYCDKKQNRDNDEKRKLIEFCCPEFSVMSRRPGIGSYYLDSIVDNVKKGCYSVFANSNTFSIPIYYSKKIKEILKDTDFLKAYEDRNNMLIKSKFNRDLLLSDLLATSIEDYYLAEDIRKKSLKKSRDNIIL